MAEYAAIGRALPDTADEELGVRSDWRLRVTQLSHRAPEALQRPRHPRS